MFFKKWRHERRKKEIEEILDGGIEVKNMISDHELFKEMDVEFSLLYISSENLVKHSKRLTWLTIGLFLTALGMIGLAIAQLLVLR